jgi:hypothetical protein
VFPLGSANSFQVSTTPSSRAYDGTDSKVSVTNIARVGDDITASLNVGGVAAMQWHYNKLVQATFAHHTTQWAWAHIADLGWRRIRDGSPDGVGNMFDALCEAVANQRKVHVHADATFVYTIYLL